MKTQLGFFRRVICPSFPTLLLACGVVVISSCSSVPTSSSTTTTTPKVSLPASVAFGSIPEGIQSSVMTATLMNTGSGSLTFSSNPAVGGTNAADFAITGSTCTTASPVAGGSSCAVNLEFTPSTMAAETATLTFADNASPATQTVPLTGTGTAAAPLVGLSPASLSFGIVAEGTTSSPLTVTVDNTGDAALTFSSDPSITGANAADFAILSSTCSTAASVAAGSSCAVEVTFKPSTTSGESASLNFADNASPAMQTVLLSGGPASTTSNSVPLTVDSGPLGGDVNLAFISITVCSPGSTTNCQTINNIQVDTGSSGLRIEASELSITLPQATNSSGDPLGDCVQFADMTYAFGPVQTADIQIAGEKASSVPIQVIAATGFPSAPSTCATATGTNLDTVQAFGANGLIGVGLFKQDCGQACVSSAISGTYYACPDNLCSPTAVPLASQLQNPVWLFPQDNQGVILTLPAISSSGATTATGTLTFGIGTQTDNALGSAQVLTTDSEGFVTAIYSGEQYADSFLDSGSNGIFFLDLGPPNFPACNDYLGFYCPTATAQFSTMIRGVNGLEAAANFSVTDIDALGSASNFTLAAFSNAGGPGAAGLGFDYGLSFFYGQTIFIGIEGQTVGSVTGPFYAY